MEGVLPSAVRLDLVSVSFSVRFSTFASRRDSSWNLNIPDMKFSAGVGGGERLPVAAPFCCNECRAASACSAPRLLKNVTVGLSVQNRVQPLEVPPSG